MSLGPATGVAARWNAVRDLAKRRPAGALNDLIAIAAGDGDGAIREEAVRALAGFAPGAVVGPLLRALGSDPSVEVRCAAAEVLRRSGDDRVLDALIAALREDHSRVQRAAADTLGCIANPRAIAPLVAAFPRTSPYVREGIVRALVAFGPAALESMVHCRDGVVRAGVMLALGATNDDRVVPVLDAAAGDADPSVRGACAAALARIGGAAVLEPLLRLALDGDEAVARAAGRGLAQFGPLATSRLIDALDDADWHVREAAARALGGIGS